MPISCNSLEDYFSLDDFGWTKELTSSPAMKLADNVITAMRMMSRLKEIESSLPGLDCGICGAPRCSALSDNIVRSYAQETDCVLHNIHVGGKEGWLPAPFRVKVQNEDTDEKNED